MFCSSNHFGSLQVERGNHCLLCFLRAKIILYSPAPYTLQVNICILTWTGWNILRAAHAHRSSLLLAIMQQCQLKLAYSFLKRSSDKIHFGHWFFKRLYGNAVFPAHFLKRPFDKEHLSPDCRTFIWRRRLLLSFTCDHCYCYLLNDRVNTFHSIKILSHGTTSNVCFKKLVHFFRYVEKVSIIHTKFIIARNCAKICKKIYKFAQRENPRNGNLWRTSKVSIQAHGYKFTCRWFDLSSQKKNLRSMNGNH